MYRPVMSKNNANGQKAVPVKLADLKDVKHPSGAMPQINLRTQLQRITMALRHNLRKAEI